MFLQRDNDILVAYVWMQYSVAIYPSMSDVLSRIEDDPSVYAVYQIEIPEIWKEVWLHNAQFHQQ